MTYGAASGARDVEAPRPRRGHRHPLSARLSVHEKLQRARRRVRRLRPGGRRQELRLRRVGPRPRLQEPALRPRRVQRSEMPIPIQPRR